TEGDDQIRMPGNRFPGGLLTQQSAVIADDVREDDFGGAVAIAVHGPGEAANQIEKPLQLALGTVDSAGACASIRPCVDGAVPEGGAEPRQLPRHDGESIGP